MRWKLQLLPISTLLSYADTTTELLDPGGKREEKEISNFHLEASSPTHCAVCSTWAPLQKHPSQPKSFPPHVPHCSGAATGALPGRNQQTTVGKSKAELKKEDFFKRALES